MPAEKEKIVKNWKNEKKKPYRLRNKSNKKLKRKEIFKINW